MPKQALGKKVNSPTRPLKQQAQKPKPVAQPPKPVTAQNIRSASGTQAGARSGSSVRGTAPSAQKEYRPKSKEQPVEAKAAQAQAKAAPKKEAQKNKPAKTALSVSI